MIGCLVSSHREAEVGQSSQAFLRPQDSEGKHAKAQRTSPEDEVAPRVHRAKPVFETLPGLPTDLPGRATSPLPRSALDITPYRVDPTSLSHPALRPDLNPQFQPQDYQ